MFKNTQKRNKWNSLVVNKLSEKHGFTGYYIRQCLKGERKSLTSDTIRKEYKQLVLKIENSLKN